MAPSIGPPGLSPDLVRRQLNRILKSEIFRRSARLCRFLEYVTEKSLSEQMEGVKEYTIGREVFDKPTDFDTRSDPVVRVEAGRLRSKILEYYATVGSADDLFIGIQARGYQALIRPREQPAVRNEPQPDNNEPCIAVLPFRDLSPKRTQDPFCEALTQEIVNGLILEPGLKVIGRTVSRRLRSDAENFATITKELGVDQIVEGSVQRLDGQIRIMVELANVQTGHSVWAHSMDKQVDDILLLQREIAREIIEGLRRVLLCGDELEPCEEDDDGVPLSRGYVYYIRGKKAWASGAVKNLESSIDCFEHAVRLDRDYANAWAALANARITLALSRVAAPGSLMRQAKAAAYRAIAIQSNLAEAHAAKGTVEALCEWNWEEARASFECAQALDPKLPLIDQWHALSLLLPMGQIQEAGQKIEHAQRADPTSTLLHYYRGVLSYMQGEYEDASTVLEVAVELEPEYEAAHLVLGDAYYQRGMDDSAVEQYQHVIELEEEAAACGNAALAYLHATRGRKTEARKILRQLVRASGRGYSWPYEVASIYTALGNAGSAFEWLNRAKEDGVPSLAWIQYDPKFCELREDERFQQLLEKIGLPTVNG